MVYIVQIIAGQISSEIFGIGSTRRHNNEMAGTGQRIIRQFVDAAMAFSRSTFSRIFHDTNINQWVTRFFLWSIL